MQTIFETRLGDQSAGRILDVATGRGHNIAGLIEVFRDYDEAIGIDTLEKGFADGLETFKDKRVSFRQMTAEQLDFPDASFDTVAISNSLHHLDDTQLALQEMARALKPDGFFILNEMFRDDQTETQMTHVLLHDWWAAVDTVAGISHRETYTRQQIVDMIEAMGLSDVEYEDYADLSGDPHDEKTLNQLSPVCDSYPDKIKDKPEYDSLAGRGQELKQRLHSIGLHWATQLLVIGRK